MFRRQNVPLTRPPASSAAATRGPDPATGPTAPAAEPSLAPVTKSGQTVPGAGLQPPAAGRSSPGIGARAAPEFEGHWGVRPSILESVPCVSTSSRSLDQAVQHGGLPLGTVTLILEQGSTDFASSLLRGFAALGVNEARGGCATRVINVGVAGWAQSLPAVTAVELKPESNSATDAGNSRDGASRGSPSVQPPGKSIKIAWRYQRSAGTPGAHKERASAATPFARDLNFKAALVPRPQPHEVTDVRAGALAASLGELARLLGAQAARPGTVLRVLVPNLLHPAIYPPDAAAPEQLIPYFAGLRALARKYRAAVVVSFNLGLYPRTSPVVAQLELLSDTCIELEPFDSPDVQGFVHIYRLARLSQRGAMAVRRHELAFTLGRSQFEVTPWGIPAIVGEEKEKEAELF